MEFINSSDIRIYSTPYRGKNGNIVFDPEARLYTEEAIRRPYQVMNTYTGNNVDDSVENRTGSFIITDPNIWKTTKSTLEFVIGGYYVSVKNPGWSTSIYASIIISGTEVVSEYRNYKLRYISENNDKIETINATIYDTKDGENYKFHGIVFSNGPLQTASSIDGTLYCLQLLDSSGEIVKNNYIRFSPESIFGTKDFDNASPTNKPRKSLNEMFNTNKIYVKDIRGYDNNGIASDLTLSTLGLAKDIIIKSGDEIEEESATKFSRKAGTGIIDEANTDMTTTVGKDLTQNIGANLNTTVATKKTETVAKVIEERSTGEVKLSHKESKSQSATESIKLDLSGKNITLKDIDYITARNNTKFDFTKNVLDIFKNTSVKYLSLKDTEIEPAIGLHLGDDSNRFGNFYSNGRLDTFSTNNVSLKVYKSGDPNKYSWIHMDNNKIDITSDQTNFSKDVTIYGKLTANNGMRSVGSLDLATSAKSTESFFKVDKDNIQYSGKNINARNSELQISSLSTSSNASVGGTLTVNKKTTLKDSLEVVGDISGQTISASYLKSGGALETQNYIHTKSNLIVDTSANIGGDLYVNKYATFRSNVSVKGDLNIKRLVTDKLITSSYVFEDSYCTQDKMGQGWDGWGYYWRFNKGSLSEMYKWFGYASAPAKCIIQGTLLISYGTDEGDQNSYRTKGYIAKPITLIHDIKNIEAEYSYDHYASASVDAIDSGYHSNSYNWGLLIGLFPPGLDTSKPDYDELYVRYRSTAESFATYSAQIPRGGAQHIKDDKIKLIINSITLY